MKALKSFTFILFGTLVLLFAGSSVALACPAYIGDYVWFDENHNGIQDEDASYGINDAWVLVWRDFDCNGQVDPEDVLFDYDFTDFDADGNPGFYFVPGFGNTELSRCYVAEVEPFSVPDLFPTTPSQIAFALDCEDKWDVDFGFDDEEIYECGDCEGKITELTLEFLGLEESYIVVEQKKKHEVVFEGWLLPGEYFTFVGQDKKGTLGTEIKIFVDGDLNTKIHTSCSKPIGPGLVSGDFEVIDGYSRNGGRLCPVDVGDDDVDDDDDDDCACDGKVTELTLEFLGSDESYVVVEQKKKHEVVFEGWVLPNEYFTFVGQDKKGTLGTEIKIFVDGDLNTKIHTSCSRPIGPGLVSGDFEVIDGYSRNGGQLCPL